MAVISSILPLCLVGAQLIPLHFYVRHMSMLFLSLELTEVSFIGISQVHVFLLLLKVCYLARQWTYKLSPLAPTYGIQLFQAQSRPQTSAHIKHR